MKEESTPNSMTQETDKPAEHTSGPWIAELIKRTERDTVGVWVVTDTTDGTQLFMKLNTPRAKHHAELIASAPALSQEVAELRKEKDLWKDRYEQLKVEARHADEDEIKGLRYAVEYQTNHVACLKEIIASWKERIKLLEQENEQLKEDPGPDWISRESHEGCIRPLTVKIEQQAEAIKRLTEALKNVLKVCKSPTLTTHGLNHIEAAEQLLAKAALKDTTKCEYCNDSGYDPYPNHDTTMRPCPKCKEPR